MNTCPAVRASSPARQCINVDFPDPDGPMIAVNCPPGMLRLTLLSAITAVSPVPYTFRAFSARTTAVVVSDVVMLLASMRSSSQSSSQRGQLHYHGRRTP